MDDLVATFIFGNFVTNLVIFSLFIFASLVGANSGLGMLGFPSKPPVQVAHPANYSELR